MKTAIVYYSMSGNCDYTARKIAEQIDADLIRIEPEKTYPDSGFRKFFWAGKSAVMGEIPGLRPYSFDAGKYGRVIFGFPVWASNPTPPIHTFIRDNADSIRGKKLAAFTCFSGGGADKALAKLKKYLDADALEAELILVDPLTAKDPKNDAAIEAFCRKLS